MRKMEMEMDEEESGVVKYVKYAFEMTPPDGEPFRSIVVRMEGGEWHVLSNDSGEWKRETRFGMADVLMPSIDLIEWKVEEIDASNITLDATGGDGNPYRDPTIRNSSGQERRKEQVRPRRLSR